MKEALNKSRTVIASAAKQSRKPQRSHSRGSPRRFAPRDDILIQRFLKTIAQVFLLALLLTGAAQAEVAVPPLSARVTDLTATLDAQQSQALESRLAAFEKKKGAQLAVLIIPTTQPETIEQFGIRVFDEWKLGRKGIDDGVLLLVAKDDRALRIEVGYGLEGALNDATAKRIITEIITPFFKRGEFYQGIDAGVATIIKVVNGEHLPTQKQYSAQDSTNGGPFGILKVMGGTFLLVFLGVFILSRYIGKLGSGMAVAGLSGGLAWLTMDSLAWAGFVVLWTGVFYGIISFVWSVLSKIDWKKMERVNSTSDLPSSSEWSKDSDGSSSSSSDSFSSGGGESGGGGASGRW